MQTEHNAEVQKLFLEIMMQNPESFLRVQNIYNAENFDRDLRSAAKFIAEHTEQFKTLPDVKQIKAITGIDLQPIPDLNEGHTDWFMSEFENFTRRQELSRAILKSADLLEKGNYDPVEKLIKDAVQISLTKDMGTDYFEDPRARLMRLKGNNGQISTGWPSMDKRLFGGMNRGELNIFAGGSGSGKSLFMQNLSLNWVLAGLNGIYLSLELSEDLCAMRLDSMLTSVPSKDIFRELDTVEMKVKVISKKAGNLWIKYMPAQSNVNHFRAYIKELQVQHNVKPDFICVDYLDLVMPVSAKVSPNDLFVKDKYVSEELRNLAKELNILLVTASQLNRSAVEEVEFDHSHISGGISKINTADNVFGIFTSRAMRERGRYQLQLMKTRSSSGVGSKIDLEFNLESLRIIDTEQEGDAGYRAPQTQSSGILDQIKNKSTALPAPETGKINAEVNSSRLKGMLASLRQGNQPG
jgi:archaellum biogenesis ATPase FlaH